MFKESAVLTGWSMLPFPIGIMIAMVILRFSKYYFRKQWKVTGDVNGHIEEMYSGHNVVKAYNGEKAALKTFHEMNGALRQAGFRAAAMDCVAATYRRNKELG